MKEKTIITGVTVAQQMRKAKEILEGKVIPRENKFQYRKQHGFLSPKLNIAIKSNA